MFFFFNDTATTEIYTLSLHDALPISFRDGRLLRDEPVASPRDAAATLPLLEEERSEEHTSELQSRLHLVCRLLLEKKMLSDVGQIVEGALAGHHLVKQEPYGVDVGPC